MSRRDAAEEARIQQEEWSLPSREGCTDLRSDPMGSLHAWEYIALLLARIAAQERCCYAASSHGILSE